MYVGADVQASAFYFGNIKQSLRQQRTMLTLMLVFVAAFLARDGVVGAGVAKYAKSVQYQSALNLIEISSIASQGSNRRSSWAACQLEV